MSGANERLEKVRKEVVAAAEEAGRKPGDIELIAVSKMFAADNSVPVIEAGQRIFGENRVQEAKSKWPALREAYPDIDEMDLNPVKVREPGEGVCVVDARMRIEPVPPELMPSMKDLPGVASRTTV